MSDDAPNQIKRSLTDPFRLCDKLGLLHGPRSFVRQSAGLIIRCFIHNDRTPSCSVQNRRGFIEWNCHGCKAVGDALHMIAEVHGLTLVGDDFRQVLMIGAELAGRFDLLEELEMEGKRRANLGPKPRPETPFLDDRTYPPVEEVCELWEASTPLGCVTEEDILDGRLVSVTQGEDDWIASRGLPLGQIGLYVRALPRDRSLPKWASFRKQSWLETGHTMIIPMYDHCGEMVSVRALRTLLNPPDDDAPKRLPPGGHKASGVVMACEFATAMLQETYRPARLLILEGEPDFLTACAIPPKSGDMYAKIGIITGSWSSELSSKIPKSTTVFVGTHDDQAGNAYSEQIFETLRYSHTVMRWLPHGGKNGR